MKHKPVVITVACAMVFIVGLVLAYADQTAARAETELTEKPSGYEDIRTATQSVFHPASTGNLSISKYSPAQWGGAAAGRPISFTLFYGWSGDGPASNVRVTDKLPSQVVISGTMPPPDSQNGETLIWDLGTLDNVFFGTIVITGAVKHELSEGTVFTNTASITGTVTDEMPEDNTAQASVKVEAEMPNLWVWKWGLLEELEEGFFFTAEQGVETTFDLLYFNLSGFPAPNTTLSDQLPAGIEYISADPVPSSVTGQELVWELDTVPAYGFGEVTIRVRPVQTGTLSNTAFITSTIGDRDATDNSSEFQFEVVPILPPRLLKPNAQNTDVDRPLIVGENPTFEGLAKAGATVTLYEGSGDGCWVDFSLCNPVALISTTADLDRQWVLTPTTMTETRTYSLYLRAELDGLASEPPFGYWSPLFIEVDPLFEQSGWDMDNFVIESAGQENRPGGLGGTTGTTPNEPFTIKIRQEIWDTVPTSPTLRANHDLRLVITEDSGEPYTVTLPVTEFQPVVSDTVATTQSNEEATSPLGRWAYDLFYVQHGFGPGSRIKVYCRPVYYPDDPNELPIVGLVWTLCNEILVDPAGYVYDVNTTDIEYEWPEVPPDDALITNATVTATVRAGDNAWARWEAEKTAQTNPQITDYTTNDGIKVPGYYAFYVPPGQYQVIATAPGCAAYTSPILTVVDAPIFHNVGMRCGDEAQIGISYDVFLPVLLR